VGPQRARDARDLGREVVGVGLRVGRVVGQVKVPLVPALRAAALALPTDDGAARIAASIMAQELAQALG